MTHVAIDSPAGLEIRTTNLTGGFDAEITSRDTSLDRFSGLTLLDDGPVGNSSELTWEGQEGRFKGTAYWGVTCAFMRDGDRIVAISIVPERHEPHTPKVGAFVALLVETLAPSGPRNAVLARKHWDGDGLGALGDDGRAAIAMVDGRFAIVEPSALVTAPHGVVHETKLSFKPYDLSIIGSNYAVLERGIGQTVLHMLDAQGAEQWRAAVPFAVHQPPIDGTNGRVYLAGDGLAAFDAGHQAWVHPSNTPIAATTFANGELAVAVGPALQFLARDGSVTQSFSADAKETFTTPPAVGSDGSVWVATAKSLYMAR